MQRLPHPWRFRPGKAFQCPQTHSRVSQTAVSVSALFGSLSRQAHQHKQLILPTPRSYLIFPMTVAHLEVESESPLIKLKLKLFNCKFLDFTLVS